MYTLEGIKLLLVDSQLSVRGITESVLRRFGIKNIITLTNAEEALFAANKHLPDIIIVDHVLRPQDGVEFTRSLRETTANIGLTPVIFTSSISAKKRVFAARDAGITEFLARPFSADSLYKRIYQVIEHPRQFVQAPNFKGPDRRRRGVPPASGERRTEALPKGVKLIQPDGILKQKVGSGGLPPALIQAAQIMMQEMHTNISFSPIAMESLDWQRKTLNAFKMNGSDPVRALRDVQDAWSLIKGNAASFGFLLVAEIASNLTDFLEPITDFNADTVSVVEAHENALLVVIKKNIRDPKNPLGRALVDELKKVNIRYIKRYMPTVA